MRRMMIFFVALAILLLGINSANAQQDLVDTVANGCKTELEKYCNQVTPGQGRVLACLYAYGDKLSSKCEYAYMTPQFSSYARLQLSAMFQMNAMRIWKSIASQLNPVKDACSNASKSTTKK